MISKWFGSLVFLFLLLLIELHAARSSFSWELGGYAGYRQDRLSYTLYEEVAPRQKFFNETFRCISGPEVGAFFSFLFYYLELGLEGDYTWIKRGDVKSKVVIDGTNQLATFKSRADGNLWDVYGRAKIHFPLYCRGWTKFALLPEGGYSIHRQSIKREEPSPESIEIAPFNTFDSATLTADFSKSFERNWWGPFVGGNILWETCDFYFNGGYSYHWLDFHQELKITTSLRTIPPSELTIETTDKIKIFRALGHRGWVTLAYRVPCRGRIGLRGTYFLSDVPRRPSASTSKTVKETTRASSRTGVAISEQRPDIKTEWHSFSILLEAAFAY